MGLRTNAYGDPAVRSRCARDTHPVSPGADGNAVISPRFCSPADRRRACPKCPGFVAELSIAWFGLLCAGMLAEHQPGAKASCGRVRYRVLVSPHTNFLPD